MPDPQERLEMLEDAIVRLREAAAGAVVLVEGGNDRAALETLGVGGTHVLVNQGATLEVFMERVVAAARGDRPVVLLVDWDRTGGRLAARLQEGLRARVRLDTDARRHLARACHVKSLEEVPGELRALRQRAGHAGRPGGAPAP